MMFDLIDYGIDLLKVVAMLMELAFPAKIIKVGRKDITINVTEEMCELGEVWEVIETGDELTDPDTGESLGSEEEEVGLVKITKPGPKFSKAEPFDNPDLLDDLEEGLEMVGDALDILFGGDGE